jgi:hypothetical protein
MHTAQTTIGEDVLHEQREAGQIYESCSTHRALPVLRSFNLHFSSRPLSRSELLLFLASMATFNRHTIGGIAILAGRLSDQILPFLPKVGHEIGAHVLDAAADEYGLRETSTHVELARNFAEHLGISTDEIEARENACSAAVELGDALFSWHDVFLKFPEYRFSREMPEFAYMRAHCDHEPNHVNGAKRCIARYLYVLPGEHGHLREGAMAYLSLYRKMFQQLDAEIFG